MIEWAAEPAAVGWPLAASFACLAAAGRIESGRRRRRLNAAMHELRRPLQALALTGGGEPEGQLDRAIDALADLDREINGGQPPTRRPVETRVLAEQAVARWRGPAQRRGRSLSLAWQAGRCVVECDPAAISRALDNLIANALEHGGGPVRVEGFRRPGRVRLHVVDGGGRDDSPRRARDSRRGHGLRVVAEVVAAHGGRFAACRHERGADAVIELPVPG
jgi:signal transduction histidine kinase